MSQCKFCGVPDVKSTNHYDSPCSDFIYNLRFANKALLTEIGALRADLEKALDIGREAAELLDPRSRKLIKERDRLREALVEAREQLGWLNGGNPMASTNVVLKRLDECIGSYRAQAAQSQGGQNGG